jgi:hypothetical protein
MIGSRTWNFRLPLVILACALSVGTASAQDTSTTNVQSGQPTVTTEVKSGEVVYASGNDLVVKVDDGQVKHFTVPESTTFNVDGKNLTVHDLKPGMRLTRTITTTSTPKTVQTVRTIKGKVWYVNAPKTVILTLPDNTNKQYKVPEGTMFNVDGQMQSVFHLRKGMQVSATVITDTPEVVENSARAISGQAPPPPPETPQPVGALLIEEPAPPPAQVAENTLPKTGSVLPLIAVLGLLFVCASFGLRALRP